MLLDFIYFSKNSIFNIFWKLKFAAFVSPNASRISTPCWKLIVYFPMILNAPLPLPLALRLPQTCSLSSAPSGQSGRSVVRQHHCSVEGSYWGAAARYREAAVGGNVHSTWVTALDKHHLVRVLTVTGWHCHHTPPYGWVNSSHYLQLNIHSVLWSLQSNAAAGELEHHHYCGVDQWTQT